MHRPLHPARRNLAGQARESPGEDFSGKDPARFLHGAGTWGTTPIPTGALPDAHRRFSGQQRKTLEPEGKRERRREKKLSPWPGASVPAPLAAGALQPGKTTAHFSLRPPRALPASRRPRERSPARGRRGAGWPPGLPLPSLLLSASTCSGLLAPASVRGLAGFLPAREVSSLYPQYSFHRSPSQRGSGPLLLSPPCPWLLTPLCPLQPSPGLPTLDPLLGLDL